MECDLLNKISRAVNEFDISLRAGKLSDCVLRLVVLKVLSREKN